MKHLLKKRILSFILTSVFILTALSGCAFPRQNPDWKEKMVSEESSYDTSDETPSEVSNKNESEYAKLLYGEKSDEYENVVDISATLYDYNFINQVQFISNSELIFMLFNEEKAAVCLYDIYKGNCEKLLETDFTENINIFIYPDCSAVIIKTDEEDQNEITFYKNLRNNQDAIVYSDSDCNSNYISHLGKLAYVKNNSVYLVNNDTNEAEKFAELPFETPGIVLSSEKDNISVIGYEYSEQTSEITDYWCVFNSEGKTIGNYRFDSKRQLLQDGNLLILSTDTPDMVCVASTKNMNISNFLKLKSKSEEPIWAKDSFFITRQNSPERIIRVYNNAEQKCISEFKLNNDGNPSIGYSALSDDKRLIATPVFSDSSSDKKIKKLTFYIIILDDREPSEGRYEYDDTDYDKLTKQGKRAYDLSEEYGVTINIYEDAIDNYDPYVPEVLKDDKLIDESLDCLENVLEKFPEGFFDELCSGDFSEMKINITGSINNNSDEEVASARAFYYANNFNEHIIVANGSYTYMLENAFAHEIMHSMDAFISNKYFNIKNSGYINWYDYLPKNYEYNNDYFDNNGEPYHNTKYVYECEKLLKNVYFFDTYQKTYDVEDRARMFEYLFVAGKGFNEETAKYGLDKRLKSEHLTNRAIYMCSVIRKCFKTVAATEQAQWEKQLGVNADNINTILNAA